MLHNKYAKSQIEIVSTIRFFYILSDTQPEKAKKYFFTLNYWMIYDVNKITGYTDSIFNL